MTITVTGLSHHTSPLEVRERVAFTPDEVGPALRAFKQDHPQAGIVVISTCNRTEVYIRSDDDPARIHEEARNFLAQNKSIDTGLMREHIYERSDREAVAHLFRVACSLDSLVVGEQQVLGQVRDAFVAAQQEGATDKITSQLFQRAFKVAKEVRTQTNIGVGKVSVASVAVDLAVSIFMDLSNKTVLVVGSGETSELTLKTIVSEGVGHVMVANRTLESAEKLAEKFDGVALPLTELPYYMHRADIIISSTGATEPVLRVADFQHALKKRNKAPVFAIDIAVPRDIEPAVDKLDNVYLYTLDDLESAASENLEARRNEVAACMNIIEDQVDKFMAWRQSLYAQPMIVSMSRELHAIRERELEKTLHALPDLTDKQRDEVEYLTKRIVNNILQRPLTSLKEEVAKDDAGRVLNLVRRLFGLEEGSA
jgi:glutamyl-tRNA reductase